MAEVKAGAFAFKGTLGSILATPDGAISITLVVTGSPFVKAAAFHFTAKESEEIRESLAHHPIKR